MEMQNNPDVTWTYAIAAVWSNLEVNLGIACNSLVSLKPFLEKVLKPFVESLLGSVKTSKLHDAQPNHAFRHREVVRSKRSRAKRIQRASAAPKRH